MRLFHPNAATNPIKIIFNSTRWCSCGFAGKNSARNPSRKNRKIRQWTGALFPSRLVNKKQAIEHMLSARRFFHKSCLFLAVKVTLPSIYPFGIPRKAHTNRKISMAFLQEKTQSLAKKAVEFWQCLYSLFAFSRAARKGA